MSNDVVSRKLFEKLKNTKYLLLLDDVWDKVDLEDVGVPAPSSENGCKVTDVIELDEIQPLARGVIRECGGLPLAVIVVGGALRREKDIHVWQNALNELRMAATSHIEDIEEKVFKRLKYSYDRLKDDNMKSCFLYCALYPEDYEITIDELIEHWRAEGFIEGARNLEARNKGHTILKYLVDMHDMIRDLALRITSHGGGEGRMYLARAIKKLEEPPKEQAKWKHANGISLMHNNLSLLPKSVDCPFLTTLFLQWNNRLKTIPNPFLEGMPALRVLDLSGTGIKQLPPPICRLKNLRGLYLRECHLLFTLPPEIGSLESLEVLVVTGIRYLPKEIGELGRLWRLRVSFSRERDDDLEHEVQRMIPDEGISRLTHLEDLRIEIDTEDERWNEIVEAVTEEIGGLKELCRLDFCFAKCKDVEQIIVGEVTNNTLQKLMTLILVGLGKLDRICEGGISWPSLDYVRILECMKLRRLPFGTDSAPSLKTIECEKEWWDSLEWEMMLPETDFSRSSLYGAHEDGLKANPITMLWKD
ncbi:Disease resistance protein [Acorus calamus]|uniref:Disease resistance protein n=1 Tax=Acorus calamus TaxID=4465 RepID=A0AAV9D2Y8_ACOCL|nr:Disease resistance protein [Acorus calamus]